MARTLDIPFPLLGVDNSTAYRGQPPHTTPFAKNVCPYGPLEGRQRGGSRNGLRCWPTYLEGRPGATWPISFLNSVNVSADAAAHTAHSIMHAFEHPPQVPPWNNFQRKANVVNDPWPNIDWEHLPSQASGWGFPAHPGIETGYAASMAHWCSGLTHDRDARVSMLVDGMESSGYLIGSRLVFVLGAHGFTIYGDMDDSGPHQGDPRTGLAIEFKFYEMEPNRLRLDMAHIYSSYDSQMQRFTATYMPIFIDPPLEFHDYLTWSIHWHAQKRWLRIDPSENFSSGGISDTVWLYEAGSPAGNIEGRWIPVPAGSLDFDGPWCGIWAQRFKDTYLEALRFDDLRCEYSAEEAPVVASYQTQLVSSSAGAFYSKSGSDAWATIDTSPIAISNPPQVLANESLFNPYIPLQTASHKGLLYIANWHPTDDGYKPLYYDPKLGDSGQVKVFTDETSYVVPQNCPLVASFFNRVYLAGAPNHPHLWYASAIAAPRDWNYFDPNKPSTHAIGGQTSTFSTIGHPLTAMVAIADDYILFSGEHTLWRMTDPSLGSGPILLSDRTGIGGAQAWCQLPGGGVLFLGNEFLNYLPPGASAPPEPLSAERIPEAFVRADHRNSYTTLAYDTVRRGAYLSVVPILGGTAIFYWFDWETKSFWPIEFPNTNFYPRCMFLHGKELLWGCQDGFIRKINTVADGSLSGDENEDGQILLADTVVEFGPFRLADGITSDGLLDEIISVMEIPGGHRATLLLEVLVADSPLALKTGASTTVASYLLSNGLSYSMRPRSRGACCLLRLSANCQWAFERLSIVAKTLGRLRKL